MRVRGVLLHELGDAPGIASGEMRAPHWHRKSPHATRSPQETGNKRQESRNERHTATDKSHWTTDEEQCRTKQIAQPHTGEEAHYEKHLRVVPTTSSHEQIKTEDTSSRNAKTKNRRNKTEQQSSDPSIDQAAKQSIDKSKN